MVAFYVFKLKEKKSFEIKYLERRTAMGKLTAVFLCSNLKKGRTKRMRYDAAEERWMLMKIRGVRGYFNDLRIDRGTLPERFRLWELADSR